MSERPPVIDYATPPPVRRWWVLPVVRELIALNLWGAVLGGGFLAVSGMASFSSQGTVRLTILGSSVESVDGRVLWTLSHVVIAVAAFRVARWHAKHWDADIAGRRPERGPPSDKGD